MDLTKELVIPTDQGLYCPPGDFHIDPHRPVERAVITHGHADHARSGSKRYWGATPGLSLMRERIGYGAGIVPLAYGQQVDFGPTRVSLHPAGHVLGSAQVRIEHQGQVWVVSGDYKRDADPTCTPFEVLPCDVFITEATFGLPVYRWQEPAEIAQEIFDWWQECKANGVCAILHCYALGKAQRILAELMRHTDETVYLHGAMTKLVKIYRDAGVAMLPTDAIGNQPKFFDWKGRLLLAPPGAGGTPWMRRFKPYSTGFASGWMRVRGSRRRQAYDRGFALSDHADWPSLLRTIQETGAKRVLAMHGNTEALVQWCHENGIAASALKAGDEPRHDEAAIADSEEPAASSDA